MPTTALDLPMTQIAEICARYKVAELSLFGSVLRDDFGKDSDVDVLVSFEPGAKIGYFELARFQDELIMLIGRNVDVVLKKGIERSRNAIRQSAILDSAVPVYVAG